MYIPKKNGPTCLQFDSLPFEQSDKNKRYIFRLSFKGSESISKPGGSAIVLGGSPILMMKRSPILAAKYPVPVDIQSIFKYFEIFVDISDIFHPRRTVQAGDEDILC